MSKMYCIPSLRPSQSCRRENKPCRRTVRDQIQSREITITYRPYAPFTRGPDNCHSLEYCVFFPCCVFFPWNRRRVRKRVLLSLQRLNLIRLTGWITYQQSNPSDESNLQVTTFCNPNQFTSSFCDMWNHSTTTCGSIYQIYLSQKRRHLFSSTA
jgi:hypothetical protein